MKRNFFPLLVACSFLLVCSNCKKGDPGPAGATGPAGPTGSTGAIGPIGAANVIYSPWANVTFTGSTSFSQEYLLNRLFFVAQKSTSKKRELMLRGRVVHDCVDLLQQHRPGGRAQQLTEHDRDRGRRDGCEQFPSGNAFRVQHPE